MKVQISQRGKEYLKTAQTLLRAAQTMTAEPLRVILRPLPTNLEEMPEDIGMPSVRPATSFLSRDGSIGRGVKGS